MVRDSFEPAAAQVSDIHPNNMLRKKKSIVIILMSATFIAAAIGIIYSTTTPTSSNDNPSIVENSQLISTPTHFKKLVTDVRLPTNLIPLEYKLNLIPYLNLEKNFTIDGTVSIDILCKENTSRVIVNIKRITIKESSVRVVQLINDCEVSNVNIPIIGHEYDIERQFYIIVLNQTLVEQSIYRVYIEYVGELSNELVGFYRSSYIDKATNETRWLGVTQFSPTDARRAFPCFDEPALKAVFEISLGRLENMTSISNMNLLSTEPIEGMPGYYWDHYNKTLLVSTYLVGFAVSDFIPREANSSLSRPKFQIWSRADAINQTDYAADVGPRMLTYLEEYFGIDFPLPKQDIIALPDMRFSAMENWGMITFRELFILYDSKYSSDAAKRRIIEIVGHELAHQWFGNLVTPSWWSELWLKEGFASYVQYIGADHVEPEWRILEIFLINDFQKVLKMDALNISHPIQVPVDNPDEINQVFDAISYSKGCSIIRMMDNYLTAPTFTRGITNYLNKWKFNSTTQNYVWESLTEQGHLDGTLPSDLTVGEIMDTWTLQKGFPVVKADRNYNNGNVTFTKEKFNYLRNVTDNADYKWWIPISYSTPTFNTNFTNTQPSFWIPKEMDTFEQTMNIQNDNWLIVNVQQTGYYIVNYDDQNWQIIIAQLLQDFTRIHVMNRAQLLHDSLNLARIEPQLYPIVFNLTNYIRNDREYLSWKSYLIGMDYLRNVLLNTTAFEPFKNYMRLQLTAEYTRLGLNETESESVLEKSHRVDIVESACKVNLADCRQKATEMFAEWMNETNPTENNNIPVNLRQAIYCSAISNGGELEWDFAWRQYLEANVASEKDIILKALACSNDESILNRYLNWSILDGSGVRKQDSRTVMQAIAENDIGNKLAFNFLQAEWTRIKEYFEGSLSIDKIINDGIAPKLKTEYDLQQLLDFKNEHDGEFGYGARAVEEAIEINRINIQWIQNSFNIVSGILNAYNTK